MKKLISLLSLATWLPLSILAATPQPNLGYESAEHIFMGNEVVLKGLPQPPKHQLILLPLENGLQLSYGDIVAMPDYYGDPDHQISSESTFEQSKQQFAHLFQSFSQYDVAYFNAFWPIIQKEQALVAAAVKAHQSVSDLYKKIMSLEMIELNSATHGKFIALAAKCFDHFGNDAWIAYQAGHAVAVDTAIAAHNIAQERDSKANQYCAPSVNVHLCLAELAQKQLQIAYAQNAYANHFLTDLMAAGHMRTPFRALVTTRPVAELGGIAGHYMHDEDNHYSIIVTNNSGQYWFTDGDDYYFAENNKEQRAVIKIVMQKSADEVYNAFTSGYDTDPMSTQLHDILPQPIDPGKTVPIHGVDSIQPAPLFKIIAGTVWERKDVNNRYDDEWVPNWTTGKLIATYRLK